MGTLCLDVSTGHGANLDLDTAAAVNQTFKLTRSNERQEMVVLNDRLASYIEKVRTLESKNKLLEAEIKALKSAFERTAGLRELYASQLKELNREAEQMKEKRVRKRLHLNLLQHLYIPAYCGGFHCQSLWFHSFDLSLASKETMSCQLDVLKSKYDEALEARKQTERYIETLRPFHPTSQTIHVCSSQDVDKATSTRIKLEKQLENLEAELSFLQRVHKEEIDELVHQIYSAASKIDLNFDLPDLSSALTQIQSQYDSIAAKNLKVLCNSKILLLWLTVIHTSISLNKSDNHASLIHTLVVCFHPGNGCLVQINVSGHERCFIQECSKRSESERGNYQSISPELRQQEHIEAVKQDLKLTKQKTALMMREYQDLLNAKMTVEIEIATYRKLIEGEDNRLSTMVGKLSLTDHLHLTNSSPSDPLASPTPPTGSLKLEGPKCTVIAETAQAVSTDNLGDGKPQPQATEKSERKTVLIR
ncbi:notochord granular surface [Anableps anableps]